MHAIAGQWHQILLVSGIRFYSGVHMLTQKKIMQAASARVRNLGEVDHLYIIIKVEQP